MNRLALCFFALFFITTSLCFSQVAGRVSGKITFEDGSPVAFANVGIKSLQKYSVTDESGHFELKDVPYGSHKVEISSIEVENRELDIVVDKSPVRVPVVMKRAKASTLGEVIVEGATEKREIETKGFAANVIETKEVSLRNYQTNELLNRTVGVRVRQNGGMGSAVDYNLNGMSGNSVRIFIDGIPSSAYGSSFSLNSIPPALIERIEVYKGVLPAHLADDALGGAINVVLKKGMGSNLTASVSYGSFNTWQGNFSGMYRNDKSGLTVKASGFYNYSDNDYEVWGRFVRNILPDGKYDYVRAKRFNDAYRSFGGQFEVGFTNVKWADQFFIGYNGSDDYNEIQHGTYMSIPYKGRFTTSQANVGSLNYRKKNLFTRGLEATMNAMYSHRAEVINDTVKWNYDWSGKKSLGLYGQPILKSGGAQQGAPTLLHISRNITTFRAGLNYDISRNHKLVFNHSFFNIDRIDKDEMKNAVEREFLDARSLQKNVSSLAYELSAFSSRFKSNIFGKYYQQDVYKKDPKLVERDGESVKEVEYTSSQKQRTGYGVAMSFAIVRSFTILASAERAVRMPTEGEIFGDPGANISENTALKPEVSNNLNLGFRGDIYNRNKHKFTLSASGFIRDTRDKIVQKINERLNDAIQTAPFDNLKRVRARGFEAEASYFFNKKFYLLVNFSKFNLLDNTRFDTNGNPLNRHNTQIPNEPFFTVNSLAQYTIDNLIAKNSQFNVFYNFGHVDRFYINWNRDDRSRTPHQFVHDFGISYTFPKRDFVVSADAKNVFDKQLYDNYGVQKPGRAFYLKINYSINKI